MEGFSTKQLVEELINRQGVIALDVAPHEPYQVIINDEVLKKTGPCRLILVED